MVSDPSSDYPRSIQGWVLPNEKLLWVGKPDPHIHLKPEDFALILLGIVMIGTSVNGIARTAVSWQKNHVTDLTWAYAFLVCAMALFLAFGLFLAAVRFYFLKKRILATEYGLTSQRLLIARGGKLGDLLSIDLRELRGLRLSTRSGRVGTINFEYGTADADLALGRRIDLISPCVLRPALHDIPEATRVFNLILEAKAQMVSG